MYLACSFFIEFDAFFVRKKEQAIYEMNVGERREWERMEKIGRIEKSELPNLNW